MANNLDWGRFSSRNVQMGVIDESGNAGTWGGNPILAERRLTEAARLRASASPLPTCWCKILAELREEAVFGVTHHGRLVAAASIPTPWWGNVHLQFPAIDPAFREHGLNCLLVPMQACGASMAADGRPLRVLMAPPPPGYTKWLRNNHFARCRGYYCIVTRRPFWRLTPKGLASAARGISDLAPNRSAFCWGARGELNVWINPRGTPYAPWFSVMIMDLLSRGELTVVGWPQVAPTLPMCATDRRRA